MEFIGREKVLSDLEKIYATGGGAVMVYGRRRMGKTTLLERFTENKRTLFLRCIKDSDSGNLSYFTEPVQLFCNKEMELKSFNDLVTVFESIIQKEKAVIVIDEFPYIASPLLSSLLQHFIDGPLKRSDSILILCGSFISVMKDESLDPQKPLFGRFKRMIELGPLSLDETREFHPNMSDEDVLRLYMTVGGVPKYHVELDSDTYRRCIIDNYILNDWMIDEPERLLESELPHPRRAMSILSAIGNGSTSLKEISQKIGVDETLTLKCIKLMMKMGIVSKINPMFDAPKRPVYVISDSMFAFHYHILQGRIDYVNPKHADEFYEMIEHSIDTFLGKRFEYICSDYVTDRYLTTEIGTWWIDKDGEHDEIDVTARVSEKSIHYDLFCECKFRKSRMSCGDLEKLRMRAGRFNHSTNPRFLLFSLSGFEMELVETADKSGDTVLIGPDELFGRRQLGSL